MADRNLSLASGIFGRRANLYGHHRIHGLRDARAHFYGGGRGFLAHLPPEQVSANTQSADCGNGADVRLPFARS